MAKLCTTCGTALPTDDARFCSICGTLVASHPANARLTAMSKNATGPSTPSSLPYGQHGQGVKPALREQFAQQPPARKDPPSWMGRLDTMPSRKGSDLIQQKRTTDPANAVWTGPSPQVQQVPIQAEYVRVWDMGEADDDDMGPNNQAEEGVEELPTRPLLVPPPAPIPQARNQASPVPAQRRELSAHVSQVEQLDTVPLATYFQSPQVGQEKTWSAAVPFEHKDTPEIRKRQVDMHYGQTKRPSLAAQLPLPSSVDVTQIPTSRLPEPNTPVAVQTPAQRISQQAAKGVNVGTLPRKKRTSLWATLLLGVVLVLGGSLWVWFYHPFSVATVTDPQQHFSDGRLGFSLSYPTGWTAQTEQHTTTLHIYDSSHTAQVDVVVADSNTTNGDVTQYLKHQATHLGMTAIKTGSPLTLGGTSWQRLQGSTQQSGANYTAMLLATVHGNHLFTITQQAPQSIYADEDNAVFSGMRSSFQFV